MISNAVDRTNHDGSLGNSVAFAVPIGHAFVPSREDRPWRREIPTWANLDCLPSCLGPGPIDPIVPWPLICGGCATIDAIE